MSPPETKFPSENKSLPNQVFFDSESPPVSKSPRVSKFLPLSKSPTVSKSPTALKSLDSKREEGFDSYTLDRVNCSWALDHAKCSTGGSKAECG